MFLVEGGVGGVDEEIIHIDNEPTFCNHIAEGVIHETLEGGGGVGKSEEHHGWFEKSFVGNEGSFPLVSVLDSYVVVSPPDVEFGEDLGISQLVHKIRDEGEWIGIADGVFVDIAVVLTWAESAVLLFNKEERRGLGGVGWADLSRGEVFIQEVLSGFTLVRGEGVHFPDLWGEGVVEIDLMIIGSRGGNVVGGFF